MADARVLVEEETENATEELTDSLLSINGKNQFKVTPYSFWRAATGY